ncbi:MAG: hypothetical protein HY706_08345 [Candidatus Hydrogenedentes bacterium]|nr:hypothetical protein [Candidatus Hydrogenedentota bacterium]
MRNSIVLLFFAVLAACQTVLGEEPGKPSLGQVVEELKALRETVDSLQATVQNQQTQIESLKQENERLETQAPAAPPAPAGTGVSPVTPSRPASAALMSVPEIGGLLDVVGALTESREDEEGNDKFSLELELTLGYNVDPYTRLDSTISFSDIEEARVEEAYLTYLGLPWELHARAGRILPKVGKILVMHRDSIDTVDEPLVIQRYFGVEGLFKTGVELSRFLPQFEDSLTQEFTLGVIEGGADEGGEMFGETRRRPTYYAHLKNFWEISPESNLELGLTGLRGSADPDARDEVNALGLDLTYLYYVTPVNKLKWQTELYYQDRRETEVFDRNAALAYLDAIETDLPTLLVSLVENGPVVTRYNDHPWGMYTLLDYRLSPRWGIGGRFDYVEPVFALSSDPRDADTGFSTYLTYYQSEFTRLRFQYEHVELASGGDDNRFFLQGTYAFGIHKHALR